MLRQRWGGIKVVGVHVGGNGHYRVGENMQVEALVDLPDIDPREVAVELYAGPITATGQIGAAKVLAHEPFQADCRRTPCLQRPDRMPHQRPAGIRRARVARQRRPGHAVRAGIDLVELARPTPNRRQLAKIFVATMVLSLCPRATVIAARPDELQSVAKQIGDEIDGASRIDSDLYAPSFLQAVPSGRLATLYTSIHGSYGRVRGIVARSLEMPDQGKFDLIFDTVTIPMSLVIEPDGAHRVTGLWFGPAVPRVLTWTQLQQQFAMLPGKASFQLQRLDNPAVLASYHPDQSLAIGSAFKLYILASLVDQKIPWDRIVLVDDRLKSLPSGNMQAWPAGSPVTVSTLAIKMISQSDNTAVDHLLAVAGRKHVEAVLAKLGMASPSADIPFLSTREAFALKADAELRKKYLVADESGRRAILDHIANGPLPDLARLASQPPLAIDKIEWFASASDLCRVMQWFDRQNDATVLGILAVNPGLPLSPGIFSYIGYKGGSEPGVLCMAWLLHGKDGHHYAPAGIWNDSSQDVDLQKFAGLMQSAAEMLEKNP